MSSHFYRKCRAMYTLGERIKHVRENILYLNQSEFANTLGFSRVATISDYETNKRLPDITSLRKIASAGKVSLEWLLTGIGPISVSLAYTSAKAKEEGALLCTDAYAEVDVYDKNYRDRAHPVATILIPDKDFKSAPFAVRIEGQAMSPTILSGATIGVDRGSRRLVSGELYAVWLPDEGITIRRVFISPDEVILRPDNPAFPETAIRSAQVHDSLIVGRAVWLYQRF